MNRFSPLAFVALFCAANTFAANLGYNQLELSPPAVTSIDCPTCEPMLDSFYLGANAGYDFYRVRQEVSVVTPNDVWESQPTVDAKGPLAGIFLGYGRNFHHFYYAGEIFANTSGADYGLSYANYQSNFQLRYSLGASLIPGIMVNRVGLVYARLSYVRSLISVSEKDTVVGDSAQTQFENGLGVGVGIEAALTYHLHLRLEVNHVQYGSFSSLRSTEFDPSDTQATVGLLYHFDVV